jgi:hypothetical protein
MHTNRVKIPVAQSQELIKYIRLLAMSGKKTFTRYLYDPIYSAGWSGVAHPTKIIKVMDRINSEVKDPAFAHTIALKCKRMITYAMAEGLSAVGDSSIFFLEKMQQNHTVSSSIESLEFVDIIEPTLIQFRDVNNTQSEKLFRDTITNINPKDLKTAFEPVHLSNQEEKVKFDSEVHTLYQQILVASKYNNIPKCRKLIASYIIKFSDSDNYNYNEVEKIINALYQRDDQFRSDLMNMIGIDLYYLITRGILENDIGKAVRGIRKYSYIFQGSPDAKYYYEIDRLERILYQLITDKNLWDELKK